MRWRRGLLVVSSLNLGKRFVNENSGMNERMPRHLLCQVFKKEQPSKSHVVIDMAEMWSALIRKQNSHEAWCKSCQAYALREPSASPWTSPAAVYAERTCLDGSWSTSRPSSRADLLPLPAAARRRKRSLFEAARALWRWLFSC
ncbi:hypothetical protein AC579_1979 [Pseudocercospora musae]|uniref:Uncharacterized protein n=1 Tax=Pseudocercospora musae TaxID=113226 RepID=A0A139I8L0_9PEZI|nr:hypothetical protein AC579_1979 [Pseudocercospora musae]KXT11059.1 hypothetical protein AC579_1979 [Pseudocercospora musae]